MIGESPLKLRECRPAEIVSSVVESNSAQAADKGLALEHTIAPDTPQVLVSDAMRIKQILSNLVTNGIKFTDDGSVRVEAHALEGSEGGVEFTVSDILGSLCPLRALRGSLIEMVRPLGERSWIIRSSVHE